MSEYVEHNEVVMSESELMSGVSFQVIHDTVNVKLKHCPFCGSQGASDNRPDKEGYDARCITCSKCGAQSGAFETIDDAAKSWNKRRLIMEMKQKKIRDCPFCGGRSEISEGEDPSTGEKYIRVECQKCGAISRSHNDAKGAAKSWNMRV